MTFVVVDRPDSGWEQVPRRLPDDDRLSLDTRAVAVWIATRTDEFVISVTGIRACLKIGKDSWQRMRRELEAAGYLETAPPRAAAGRFAAGLIFHVVPVGGWPAAGGEKQKQPAQPQKTAKKREKQPAQPEPAQPAPVQPAPAEPAVYKRRDLQDMHACTAKNRATKRKSVHAGVICWGEEDRVEAELLVSKFGESAVRAAADIKKRQGVTPLPSRVAEYLHNLSLGEERYENSITAPRAAQRSALNPADVAAGRAALGFNEFCSARDSLSGEWSRIR